MVDFHKSIVAGRILHLLHDFGTPDQSVSITYLKGEDSYRFTLSNGDASLDTKISDESIGNLSGYASLRKLFEELFQQLGRVSRPTQTCEFCSKEIDIRATICPHCSFPTPTVYGKE